MNVTVTRGAKLIDRALDAIPARVAPLIVGRILARTAAHRDANGNALTAYSSRYAEIRVRMGRSTAVDLRITGGLMTALRHVDTRRSGGDIVMLFGVGTGTSAAVHTARRSAPHNLLAYWMATGQGQPRRDWMDLRSRDDVRWLAGVVAAAFTAAAAGPPHGRMR